MTKIGEGISMKVDKYREFGKFIINYILLDDNILLIKYKKSFAPFAPIRRTKISNELKDMIHYLFDTGEIDYKSGQKLTSSEKQIFDTLITKSGLKTQLKYSRDKLTDSIEDIIEEFNILKGVILAGNDNPKLKEDIKVVLGKLVRLSKITQEEADDIISDL